VSRVAARGTVKAITAERFHDMLNILPPCDWQHVGGQEETYKLSELVSTTTATAFCRIGDAHFELVVHLRESHREIVAQCRDFQGRAQEAA
jgi:hypothetical protein